MFEKFTEGAIKVIMLSQEEARRMGHNFVGTEQLLLGVIGQRHGIGARALKKLKVTLKKARKEIELYIGRGTGFVASEIPFTPRAKRVLEMAVHEGKDLGQNFVGTEHILLALIGESDGVAMRTLDKLKVDTSKKLPIKLMLNVGSPEMAFSASMLPNDGVGLARLEFIINDYIKIHPMALLQYPNLNIKLKEKMQTIMGEETDGKKFFINKLAKGISKIASAFYPNDVIVRLSDFKSNEYKNLVGGELYEPDEENPMIGWRGASRYYSDDYKDAFALECLALKYARENMGLDNIIIMIV